MNPGRWQGPASPLVRGPGMGSGFISRSDDVPDPIAEGRPRPTEDGQPYLKQTEYR